jgi:hypothetical protein
MKDPEKIAQKISKKKTNCKTQKNRYDAADIQAH